MISFKYHVVTIAAVFLALAAGVALGAGLLDDAGASLGNDDDAGSADPALTTFDVAYANRTADSLLGDALDGESVVVLTMPGSSVPEVKGVSTTLEQAGAEVTGQVELTGKLLDAAGRQFAEGVAEQSAADVAGVGEAGDSYGRIGAALGRALLADKTSDVDGTATTIRSAFVEGDLLTLTEAPGRRATLAVVVAPPRRADEADRSSVVAELAGALASAGKGVVVAGPTSSSTDGGAVKAVRDGDSAAAVSTVDVTDSPAGRVVVALAAARAADGKNGAWGTSRSSDGAVPR